MSLESIQAEALKPQPIEPLTEIYAFGAAVYRLDDARAVVQLGACAAIVRPWRWTAAPPDTTDYWGVMPPKTRGHLERHLNYEPIAVAHITFGSLLLWSSRRMVSTAGEIAWDDTNDIPLDSQEVGSNSFNRVVIREVLQTWVETGERLESSVMIERLDIKNAGPALRVSLGDIQAVLMGLHEWPSGSDPLKLDWKLCSRPRGGCHG